MLQFIGLILNLLAFLIFLRALLSWLNLDPRSPIISVLYQLTEPILEPLRRVIPRIGMMDITPMVAMFVLFLIGNALTR